MGLLESCTSFPKTRLWSCPLRELPLVGTKQCKPCFYQKAVTDDCYWGYLIRREALCLLEYSKRYTLAKLDEEIVGPYTFSVFWHHGCLESWFKYGSWLVTTFPKSLLYCLNTFFIRLSYIPAFPHRLLPQWASSGPPPEFWLVWILQDQTVLFNSSSLCSEQVPKRQPSELQVCIILLSWHLHSHIDSHYLTTLFLELFFDFLE